MSQCADKQDLKTTNSMATLDEIGSYREVEGEVYREVGQSLLCNTSSFRQRHGSHFTIGYSDVKNCYLNALKFFVTMVVSIPASQALYLQRMGH